MVLIEGEAGMGKSALLQAFLRNLQSGTGTGTGTGTRSGSGTGARQIWSVRCDPFEQH
jgi:archaellum biogenesis ATPase FlaH